MGSNTWGTLVASAALALAGCSDSLEPGSDAAVDGPSCARACDDGVFCNGAERCAPGEPAADADGCVAGDAPCDGMCDEDTDACASCEDADGDGSLDARCGGGDCDDADPLRYPGAVELCDAADVDEDCNPETYGVRDADGDTYADGSCCNGASCGPDCDDASAGVHPASAETCDGRNNDCDDGTDEGVVPTFYVDADGDGHGDATAGAAMMRVCLSPGLGWSPTNDDCDDTADDVHPGLPELCNERDDDCRDGVDDGIDCMCSIGATRSCSTAVGECRIGTERCIAGMWGPCDGGVFGATETCSAATVGSGSARDEDCDGAFDETLTAICYADGDGDGYGAGAAAPRCAGAGGGCPESFAASGTDCDDGEMLRRPDLAETCDTRDNDCDGVVDDGLHVERTYVPPASCEVWEFNRTRACDGRVADACRSIAGPGECAHQSGFATYIGGAVDAVCVAGDTRATSLAELATHHPGCDGTDTGYPACRAAAHRLCISYGPYIGGFGYVRAGVNEVTCFTSAQAEIRHVTWAELDARDGAVESYCGGFPADGWWCNRAADRYCIDAGFHAGFGPVEQNGSAATLLCLRDY